MVIWSPHEQGLNKIQGLGDDSADQDTSKKKSLQEEHAARTQAAENESRELSGLQIRRRRLRLGPRPGSGTRPHYEEHITGPRTKKSMN
jgi:hypothetical protein